MSLNLSIPILTSCNQIPSGDLAGLCKRIRHNDPEEFDAIYLASLVHGHIGPYTVIGAKMGLAGIRIINAQRHEVRVVSYAGNTRPLSCIHDGLIAATGATVSYGTTLFSAAAQTPGKPEAEFEYREKKVRLILKPEVHDEIKEKLAVIRKKYGMQNDEYFSHVRTYGLIVWETKMISDIFSVSQE